MKCHQESSCHILEIAFESTAFEETARVRHEHRSSQVVAALFYLDALYTQARAAIVLGFERARVLKIPSGYSATASVSY